MVTASNNTKKCKWATDDGYCELRGGISDDDSCNGTYDDMYWCAYVNIEKHE